jgi:glycerol-3-phosphate dehydrogenase (NAD(P)+)
MSDAIGIAGAGAWGIALGAQATRAGRPVRLWARDRARAEARAARLGVALAPWLVATPDALHGAMILVCVPAQHAGAIAARLPAGTPLVACAKGIESGTLRLPLEVLAAARPDAPLAVLSGPCFAAEVAHGLATAAVAASGDAGLAAAVCAALGTPSFRLYRGTDPVGVQVGGAAKNVVAIAAGVCDGAGLGQNARAALVTRGLAEMTRLAVALGGQPATLAGLAGLGDLLLTCTGAASRNHALGEAIGRGGTVADSLARSAGVAEGAASAAPLVARAAGAGVDLPIIRHVAALLDGRLTVPDAVAGLISRPAEAE